MHWTDRPLRFWLLPALTLAACSGAHSDVALPPPALIMEIVSGGRQRGPVGQELPHPVIVQLVDAQHRPVRGQLVRFRVVSGGGSMYAGSSITDRNGMAEDYWTMGPQPGLALLQVRVVDPTLSRRTYALVRARALEPPREAAKPPESSPIAGAQ